MGVGDWNIVISSNVALRRDGLPYANQAEPNDVGIAVFWFQGGDQRVIACDHWDRTRDNLRAIEKTIEAMRGIDRWGSTDIMDRAFSGFAALPAPAVGWRAVMNFPADLVVDGELLRSRYRKLAHEHHPDHGGLAEDMAALVDAYNQAKKEIL
jgi:hypothetical protein